MQRVESATDGGRSGRWAGSADPPWRVVLLGGSSGTGKSTLAPLIARQHRIPWLEADDFRLAIQRATTPASHPALHFFLTDDMAMRADFWQLPPEAFRDGLIAVGEVVSDALEIVVANHVGQGRPIVLEGDGILPAMAARRTFSGIDVGNAVRAIFLVEPDLEALVANMLTRSSDASTAGDELRNYARASWLYGMWLRDEAQRHGLPVLDARPYETLLSRVLLALA
jgi:2-phosphoglycerate kinase